MPRINLYNYRACQLHYQKLRLYLLLVIAITVSGIINLGLYSYYAIKVFYQTKHNESLLKNTETLQTKLKPIYDFNNRISFVQHQMELLEHIEHKRSNAIIFLEQINIITPLQIYYTEIDWENNLITLNGIARSPVYLAGLLDQLRLPNGIFYSPILKLNNALDTNKHSFKILVSLKADL